MKKRVFALLAVAVLAFFVEVTAAFAAPRSGGSFSGRGGFRSGGGSYSRSYGQGRTYGGGGSHFFFFPSFGWGWGGYGGGFGSLIMLAVVAFGVVTVMRSMRRVRAGGPSGLFGHGDDEEEVVADRAWVYKIQLGLGRSAREIQNSLARYAAEGDTSSEAGLAQLLQQTSLELMRHKDSIRYGHIDPSGPMSLTNGETKMNAAALAERSRFHIERVRGADGRVLKSEAAATESNDALEYLVITIVVATRRPVIQAKEIADPAQLQGLLGELGAVPPTALLGLEVIWTPADPSDALSKDDLVTTYPELRSF
ncbi:MAG TPA: DUF1517 domain-containing protein [Polyangia bacterium]|nr:DUF1517 domain-containing protein [Polyangia bacterium]